MSALFISCVDLDVSSHDYLTRCSFDAQSQKLTLVIQCDWDAHSMPAFITVISSSFVIPRDLDGSRERSREDFFEGSRPTVLTGKKTVVVVVSSSSLTAIAYKLRWICGWESDLCRQKGREHLLASPRVIDRKSMSQRYLWESRPFFFFGNP